MLVITLNGYLEFVAYIKTSVSEGFVEIVFVNLIKMIFNVCRE
jgi:hypothetical protein